jgi:hypothetical protein
VKAPRRPSWHSAAVWAPFVALFGVFLWPLLVLKKGFVLGDYDVQHYPWAQVLYRSLQEGGLPFWTDLMACGFPLVAEGQAATFYLLHRIASRVLPFEAAYAWMVPLHLGLGAFGFYRYARALGFRREAAAAGVLSFSFGSAFGGCFYNTGSLRVLTWLPFALWVAERCRGGPARTRALAALGLAALFAQMWNAGFPQIAVYAMAYFAAHECCAAWQARRTVRWTWLAWAAAALVAGAVLALPQIVALAELVPLSVRAGETPAFALWGSVPPPAAVSLLFPQWGNALRASFYIGVLPLFFIAVLAAAKGTPVRARHAFLAVLFFALALGRYNPLYAWAVEAFRLTLVRNPAKFLFFAAFSLAVLSANGCDALLEKRLGRAESARARRLVRFLGAGAALLPLFALAVFEVGRDAWTRMAQRHVLGLAAERGIGAEGTSRYLDLLGQFTERLEGLFTYANPFTLGGVVLALLSAALVLRFLKGRLDAPRFVGAAALLFVADLYCFGRFFGVGFMGNAGPFPPRDPAAAAAVRERLAPGDRFVEFMSGRGEELFPPNRGMLYGIAHAGGYSPLLLKRYAELAGDLGIADASLGRAGFDAEVWKRRRGLLDLLGVGLVRSDAPLDLAGLEKISEGESEVLYRNARALPLVAGFTSWKALPDRAERLDYLKGPAFDPGRTLVLEDAPPGAAPATGPMAAGRVLAYGAEGLEAELDMPADGFGLVRIAAYPGWRIEVDGRSVPVLTGDHAFLAFPVEKGPHRIRAEFRPRAVEAARAAAGLAWVAAAWLAWAVTFRPRR